MKLLIALLLGFGSVAAHAPIVEVYGRPLAFEMEVFGITTDDPEAVSPLEEMFEDLLVAKARFEDDLATAYLNHFGTAATPDSPTGRKVAFYRALYKSYGGPLEEDGSNPAVPINAICAWWRNGMADGSIVVLEERFGEMMDQVVPAADKAEPMVMADNDPWADFEMAIHVMQ